MKDAATPPDSPLAPDPLAVALSKLDPAPHGFDRDALMFAAGRASKWRAITMWKTIAIVALLAAAMLAGLYFAGPRQGETIYLPVQRR